MILAETFARASDAAAQQFRRCAQDRIKTVGWVRSTHHTVLALGAGVRMPKAGRGAFAPRPRGRGGLFFVACTMMTPPAKTAGIERPVRSQNPEVLRQNRLVEGG